MSVLSVCLSPGFQRSGLLDTLHAGEVNRFSAMFVDASGKGVNVCRVLNRLAFPCLCLAQGGENAAELLALAGAEGLPLELVPAAGKLRTCTSVIETGSAGRVTELVEPAAPVDADTCRRLEARFDALLAESSALVVSGSMAAGFPDDFQAKLILRAKAAGVPTFVDLHAKALQTAVRAKPDIVKINLSEFTKAFLPESSWTRERMGAGSGRETGGTLAAVLADRGRELACDFILTNGPEPVTIIHQGQVASFPVPVLPAGDIVSPIGSGDSFMAGLIAGLGRLGALAGPRPYPIDSLLGALPLAVGCAQANARTSRPGFLDPSSPL
jgi:1-phosphofructokinase/tagatose 6-phosphate kinase